ncbi:MAG TPA: type IV toxin-antitoxin system AbiEi family antitoxin domain-containing protein, partial [Bacteroidaceae bacterium]|nr:type IV toxin-antitoxin system AbiEi family antitoxin domain-containing protein [Bacteroidaceae bacterium]
MSINNEIQNFALERSVFSRAELLENFSDFDEKTLSQQLYRLVKSKNLERVGRGVYRLTASIFPVSDEMRQLNNMLKKQFPFAVFCLWNSEALMPFMHHIPDLDYIY